MNLIDSMCLVYIDNIVLSAIKEEELMFRLINADLFSSWAALTLPILIISSFIAYI